MHIPVGYAQVNIRFSGNAAPTGAECTFGISLVESTADYDDLASDIGDLWASTIGTQQTSQVGVQSVLLKVGPNDSGPFVEVPGPGSGGVGSTSTPANFSVLIKKSTALGGRKHAGRMYVPGIAESVVGGNGIIDASAVTGYQAAADDFLEGLATADAPMVLLHADLVTAPDLVTALSVQGVGATQRRRQRR